jgi:hypothetical protein
MKSDIFKRLILTAMALLLVAIWTRNLLLFLPSRSTENVKIDRARLAPDSAVSLSPAKGVEFTFSPTDRDPFAVPPRQEKLLAHKIPSQDKIAIQGATLHATLQGIVWENKSPCVVAFDSSTGTSSLYRLGDSLAQFRLVQVDKNKAVWKSRRGSKVVWTIDE